MTIGILGGGQLGYMLALAGYPLGLRFRFLDPSPESRAPANGQRGHYKRQKAGQIEEIRNQRVEPGYELRQYERGEERGEEPWPHTAEPCCRDDAGQEQPGRMKKWSDGRKVQQYGDCDTSRGQRIPQRRGFFQLRHDTMRDGWLGAVARGRSAASIAETGAPM